MYSRLPLAIIGSLVLVAICVRPARAGDPSFHVSHSFGTGADRTESVVTGDVDGDGDLDIVTGNYEQQNVVYLNDGAGNFTSARNFGTGSDKTRSVALGDMDGDGDLDIVAGNDGQQNAIYFNDGVANFTTFRTFGPGADSTTSVAVGDMNGDGDLDIVAGNYRQQSVVYFNDGAASFLTTRTFGPVTDNTRSIALGDMNGDGHLDIVVGNDSEMSGPLVTPQNNAVYLNDGGANFTTVRSFAVGVSDTYSVAVGDLDGDHDLDIIVGNGDSGGTAGNPGRQSYVFLNVDGAANFTTARSFGPGTISTGSVAAADVDGDGDVDIVAGHAGVQNFVYLNDGAANFPRTSGFGPGNDNTGSVAAGDMDGDGHLDIVAGNGDVDIRTGGVGWQNVVSFNDGGGNFTATRTLSSNGFAYSTAVGDMNNDGALDIVAGNDGPPSTVYLNRGDANFPVTRSFGMVQDFIRSVALGDLNGDGYLDIVAANSRQQSFAYLNSGDTNFLTSRSFGASTNNMRSVAVGDMDADGDLDIVAGIDGQLNEVYLNEAVTFATDRGFGTGADNTRSVALGDLDGDGDLDIVAGNYGQQSVVYLNDGAAHFHTGHDFGPGADTITSVAVGDMDGDGDLDIVAGRDDTQNAVYLNDGAANFAVVRYFDGGIYGTSSIAVGDLDSDGDLDIVAGGDYLQSSVAYLNDGAANFAADAAAVRSFNTSGEGGAYSVAVGDLNGDSVTDVVHAALASSKVFLNRLHTPPGLTNPLARGGLSRPIATRDAGFYSTPVVLSDRLIAVPYVLRDAESDTVGRIEVQYSFGGGGRWLPAVGIPGTQTTHLTTTPAGVVRTFVWDTLASGFFGQSDNVVLRLVVYAQANEPAALGTYKYVKSAPGPFQRAYFATQTFPFRVRGTQVRVLQDNQPLPGASVYRLGANNERGGDELGSPASPYRTDGRGYLLGRGEVGLGDRLLALLPVTQTATYDVYYTSPSESSTGLPDYTIAQTGVQTLTVSSDNPLVLFNLDVALEWDASKDTTYLTQLQYDLNRTSELLYGWSNGQAALGRIRIFHDARRQPEENGFQPWLNSHIRIYASNAVHPNAIQGGIVSDRVEETTPNGKTGSYTPGMVHIGAVWNRYADSSSFGEDWPRALAHELGHYLFFLDDNYIGQAPDGSVQFISSDPNTGCPGVMNDPYTDFLAKYHPQGGWLPGCTGAYSQQLLGRSDWETIVAHYPWLKAPSTTIDQVNPGPSGLRLAFTQIEVVPPSPAPDEQQTLDLPIFTISTAGGSAYQPGPDAYAFLLQGAHLIELGAPSLDQLVARGARNGDTLCLLEPDNQRAGCVKTTPGQDQLVVQPVPDWRPQVVFTPVTSRTLTLQVLGLPPGLALKAQLYPRDGDATPAVDLAAAGAGYSATFDLPEPVFEGNLRIFDVNNPLRQVLTDFVLGSNPERWDSRDARWRARLARWRRRRVPVIASGGKVAVLGDNVAFGSDDWVFSLQAATALPKLPAWATPIGQGYWLHASANAPSLANTAISFNYDRRDVPPGQENALRVFYWNGAAGSDWTLLPTNSDPKQFIASALTQGPGLYVLAAAPEIPLQGPGWNIFAYSIIGDPTPVDQALNSIAGAYSIVYAYEPTNPADPWRAFDPTAPDWANDLKQLEYGKSYVIYAKQPTILHPTAADTLQAASPADATTGLVPPAVFYGIVQAAQNFSPQPGMIVTASIDGRDCGQAQTQLQGSDIVYAVDVAADGSQSGCGAIGRTVGFKVAEHEMPTQATWDNTRASNAVLGADANSQLYLPAVKR